MNVFSVATENKEIVRRFVEEVVNRGRTDMIDHLVSDDFVFHCPDGDLYGPKGALLNVNELRGAFPDLYMDLTELINEGDLVARRFVLRGFHLGPFLGLDPSDEEVAIPGIGMDRVVDGRITESWVAYNTLGMVPARLGSLR